MKILNRRSAAAALAAAVALGFIIDPNDFAVSVKAYAPGPFGSPSPNNALDGPQGAGTGSGSFHVVSLGPNGSLTLKLGNSCVNGAGTDLLVCENPFFVADGGSFAELAFVEVSTNGSHFARFPNRYTGPQSQLPSIQGAPLEWYRGYAGLRPVVANVQTGQTPYHVVSAGADAFDLADLADDPLVQAGTVDLGDIRYVRLIDIDSGNGVDSMGTTIWDCGLDLSSSADVDAIVALNSDNNQFGGRPRVELSLDAQGFLSITVTDFDGWKDVKNGLTAALDGTEFPFAMLFSFCLITNVNQFSFTLFTGPVPPGAFPYELRIAATDTQGMMGGDALQLP